MSDEEDNKTNVAKLPDNDDDDDCYEIDPVDFYDKLSLCIPNDDEKVIAISEKGQVALRDFPHPRHLCANFPFKTTSHESYCSKCFCSVCDIAAPCEWRTGTYRHCQMVLPRFYGMLENLDEIYVSEDEW